MLNLRLHIYNNKICNSSLVQGFPWQPTLSEGRFPPSFVVSLCRQIPGCSLSPTGAGGSAASTVGQPLIGATRDSRAESCGSISLTSIRGCPGCCQTLARARGASTSPNPTLGQRAGSTQSHMETGKEGHWVSHSHPLEQSWGTGAARRNRK